MFRTGSVAKMKLKFLLQMYIIVFLESVTGLVEITINPPQVVQDVDSTQSLSFSCNVGAATEIKYITSLKLMRKGQSMARIFALPNMSGYIEKTFEQEATSRGFVLDWKFIPSPLTASITLTLKRSKVMCSDQLQYSCHLDYFNLDDSQSEEKYANLSVYVPPSMVQNALKVYKNSAIIGGGGTKETASTSFKVGDTVTLECDTSVGSDSTAKIYWKITSEVSDNAFVDITLPAGKSSDEVTSAGQCEFTRKAKAQYNITSFDANRNYKTMLGFVCYVVAFQGDTRYVSTTSEKFYIDLGQSAVVNGNAEAVAAAGSAVAIAGGVIGGLIAIVIIVLLVYFLWYRNRTSGEDYATKEEYESNYPNRAPSPVIVTSSDYDYDAKKYKDETSDDEDDFDQLKPIPKPREKAHIGSDLHYAELNLIKTVSRKSKPDPVEYKTVRYKQ